MHLTLVGFIFSLVTTNVLFAQSGKEQTKLIRQWYGEIESSLTTYKIVKLNDYSDPDIYEGYSPEIKGWYNEDVKQFVKIEHTGMADWHEEIHNIYLRDEQPFFIYTKGYSAGEMYTAEDLNVTEEELWEMGGKPKTIDHFESRIYFSDKKVIEHLTKRKSFSSLEDDVNLSDVKNEKAPIDQVFGEKEIDYIARIIVAINKSNK